MAIPVKSHEKNHRGHKVQRVRNESIGMTRDIRGQLAQGSRDEIRQRKNSEQRSGNFQPRMPRSRNEMRHQQSHPEEQRDKKAAHPPGDRSPQNPDLIFVNKLEEQDAGGRQRRSRKQKARAKNQRDAILSSLESHEGYCGKDESKEARRDLQIALEDRIGPWSELTQPEGGDEHEQESAHVQKEALKKPAINDKGKFAHAVPAFGRVSILRVSLQ